MRKRVSFVYIIIIVVFLILIGLSIFARFSKKAEVPKDIMNQDVVENLQSAKNESEKFENRQESEIIFDSILTQDDEKKTKILSKAEKEHFIAGIAQYTAERKYQDAIELLKQKALSYKMKGEIQLSYILSDLTMIVNLVNNPEQPQEINTEIYAKTTENSLGRNYHVKDKLPVTFYSIQNFKSPEICAIASLHFSYELICYSVMNENSYVNLVAPGEVADIIKYNPELTEKEKEFVVKLKRNNNIADVFIYQMKNINRNLSFKAYVYKEYESQKVSLYGYFLDDLAEAGQLEISTAKHFMELYSASAEKREIDFSKLDYSK